MSDNTLNTKLKGFKAISLRELNATASFLKRIDRKYLLNSSQFLDVVDDLRKNFDILEIDGKKVFTYDNIYMDSENYVFYNQHQNKVNSRVKVRTRLYVESNMAFFEFKHKINGVTNKYRYEFPANEHGFMTKGKKRFFDGVWQSIYKTPAPGISPSIKTNYKRITMVSKKGNERLTIDFDVKAINLRKENASVIDLKNLIIIESKSLKNISEASRIMETHGIERAYNCSKYSLGIVYSGLAEKYDTFKDTMEQIKHIRMETVQIARNKNVITSGHLNRLVKDFKENVMETVSI